MEYLGKLSMKKKLNNCIIKSLEVFKRVYEHSASGVYLYGAGFVGRWSIDYLENLGIPVLGFVDSDSHKWGMSVFGRNIFSPSDPKIVTAKVILISSRHAVIEIKKSLSHLPALIMSIDAFVVHFQGSEKIAQMESLFTSDNSSLQTFHAVLCSMLDGTSWPLSQFLDNQPLFGRFGFFNRDNEVFVDAGAYVGDSLERFIWSVNGVFKHIHAFEPGKAPFASMQKRVDRLVSEWAINPKKISLVNKAISSISSQVYVESGSQLTSTRVSHEEHDFDETSKIETISLDDYFNGEKFTFLKVDIEGSESKLLLGASSSIIMHRPRIALSVYHYPTDIFDLPNQLLNMNSEYTFSLGHHSTKLMETILYCRDKND